MTAEKDLKKALTRAGRLFAHASVSVKACRLKDARVPIGQAYYLIHDLPPDLKDNTLVKVEKATSHVYSLMLVVPDSQNAADQASRISGMLDILAMILE